MLAHLGAMLGYVGPSGRHLGATWRQDAASEMRQDSEKLDFWRPGVGEGPAQVLAMDLGSPPLRIAKGTAGAPPGGFGYQLKKLRLRLSTDRVTQQVPTARSRIYIYIYIYIYKKYVCIYIYTCTYIYIYKKNIYIYIYK